MSSIECNSSIPCTTSASYHQACPEIPICSQDGANVTSEPQIKSTSNKKDTISDSFEQSQQLPACTNKPNNSLALPKKDFTKATQCTQTLLAYDVAIIPQSNNAEIIALDKKLADASDNWQDLPSDSKQLLLNSEVFRKLELTKQKDLIAIVLQDDDWQKLSIDIKQQLLNNNVFCNFNLAEQSSILLKLNSIDSASFTEVINLFNSVSKIYDSHFEVCDLIIESIVNTNNADAPNMVKALQQLFNNISFTNAQICMYFINTIKNADKNDLPKVVDALIDLWKSPSFAEKGKSTKVVILSQCEKFPNSTSINKLTSLVGVDWFYSLDESDKYRAAWMIANMGNTYHLATTTNRNNEAVKEQLNILDNTLNILLSGKISLAFDRASSATTHAWVKKSSKDNKRIFINIDLINRCMNPQNTNDIKKAHHLVGTVSHEMQHLQNMNIKNSDTYEYFQDEYAAWYVGYIAEHGTYPTRQKAYERCVYLVTQNSGSYKSLKNARTDNWFWLWNDGDSKRIVAFMNKFNSNINLSIYDTSSTETIIQWQNSVTDKNSRAPKPDSLINLNILN